MGESAAGSEPGGGPRPAGFTDVPLSRRQAELNATLRRAAGTAVGTSLSVTIAEEAVARIVTAVSAEHPEPALVTPFQVLAHLAARTAAQHPRLRARRAGLDRLRVFDTVNVGIAVSAEDGELYVLAVHGADRLSAREFGARYAQGIEHALAGKSTMDGRVTLLLSHLDVDWCAPAVVPPAAATLFIGTPHSGPGGPQRQLVLTFDHCVLNGQQGAAYLAELRATIQQGAHTAAPAIDAPAPPLIGSLQQLAERVAGHPLDPHRPLGEQGVSSAIAVALAGAVNERFSTDLPATAVWRYPTLQQLALALPATSPRHATIPAVNDRGDGVAIVGMACRVAGAEDVEDFWELLRGGRVVLGHGRSGGPAVASMTGSGGALLARIDLFDAEFFGIPPRQAAAMDPQQRHLLELSWHALESAGIAPGRIVGTDTGVFVGASSYDYRERVVSDGRADGYSTVGTFPAFLANRVSHTYDLRGPSITIDTACSAGLTAVHAAICSLQRGECSLALVGAANLLCNPFNDTAFQHAGMLSPTGQLHAFDDRANGYVRGEGVGWVVLRRLEEALSSGDPIHAVVRGTAANHGGRAASLTSPSTAAQAELVRAALLRADVDVHQLGYLEAHGTGTPLGDPIELDALREVLADERPCAGPDGRLWLGTVKANIGHLEGAAGLLGLIKAVLVVRDGVIPAVPGFQRLNPEIRLSGTPLAVVTHPVEWPARRRLAAVSSFGIGGSNAHVVLEQPPEPLASPASKDPMARVFPLSAASPVALRALAAALAARTPERLDAIAWTLQSGRDALPHRALVRAEDRSALVTALRAVAAGQDHEGVRRASDHLAGQLPALTSWLAGGELDWRSLWSAQPPQRVPLVPYPFAGSSHWHGEAPQVTEEVADADHRGLRQLVPVWVEEPQPILEQPVGPVLIVHDEQSAELAQLLCAGCAGQARLVSLDDVTAGSGAEILLLPGGAHWSAATGSRQVRRWVQAITALGSPARVRLVTTGMVDPTGGSVTVGAALQGTLIGALRTLPREHSDTQIAIVDVLPDQAPCPTLLREPTSDTAPVIASRPGTRYRQWFQPQTGPPVELPAGSAHLVLGGTGGLGRHLASWLATEHRANLLLVARSPEDTAVTDQLRAAGGAQVHYRSADLSRPGTAAALVAECQRLFGRVDGVVNAVSAVRTGLAGELTAADLDAVLTTKLDATLELYEAVRAQCPQAWLLLCSSVIGAFGGHGATAYAAASSFLGCFAEAVGPHAMVRTVDWGVWQETGLATRFGAWVAASYPELVPLDPAQGIAAVRRCLGGSAAHTIVLAGDAAPLRALVTGSDTGADAARHALERYALEVAKCLLDDLGVPAAAATPATVAEVAERTGIAPGYHALLGALLAALAQHGEVQRLEQRYHVRAWQAPTGPSLAASRAELLHSHPDLAGQLRVLDRVQQHYPAVLRGTEHYTAALFPGGDLDAVAAVYEGNRLFDPANRALADAVVTKARTAGRALRVLEVGAGVGATTACVLAAARAAGVGLDYTYTDVSPAFLRKGTARFGPQVSVRMLDLEEPLTRQGFAPGSADIIVASNVLHATTDLTRTLRALRELLAEKGSLLATEVVVPSTAYTVVFGLTDGWWLAADTDRLPHSPLLDVPSWRELVRTAGYRLGEVHTTGVAPGALAVLDCSASPGSSKTVGAPETAGSVREIVTQIVAEGVGSTGPRTDLPWREIGVDSLLTVEILTRLSARFGPLPPTTLFEHPTIDALATHLGGAESTPGRPVVRFRRTSPAAPDAIAVIGVAAEFPGAPDVDALWRLLRAGDSPVSEVPADRWDWRVARTVTGSYARWGCFLSGWERFDSVLFRVLPRDAAAMDPQERLFLRTAVEAFEVAGYGRPALRGRRVGVFAGVTSNSHLIDQRDRRCRGAENPEYAISALSSVANRVSYLLDLQGPSIAIDTMCSSSLTAVHLACTSLATGESELALAGGVNLYLHPDRFAALCSLGMPSRGERTRAFGKGADGFVPGEGVAAIVLKPLAAALAAGDAVHAVLVGTGVNHGGRAGGYTVPNPTAQTELIKRTLDQAGISPSSISCIEAHGTGTTLGDPVELRALSAAFRGAGYGSIAIGSIKSNLGHSEAAAGIAGLLKVILQLRHGQLVRTLWAEQENPLLELAERPFRLQRVDQPWPSGTTSRRAAVSSFGAGGSNAHVIVEAPPAGPAATPPRGSAMVIPLSAPDPAHLRCTAQALLNALTNQEPSLYAGPGTALADIAHTLALGREVWPHRAAVVCRDIVELAAGLTALAQGAPHPTLVTDPEQGGPAGDWVHEGDPDRLPAQPGARRVPLPPSPSIGQPLSVEAPEPARPLPAAALPFVSQVRPGPLELVCRVDAADPWFAEHVLDGEAVLAGAFGVELVFEALLAAGVSAFDVELHELCWPAPVRRAPVELRVSVTTYPEGHRIAVHDGDTAVVTTQARTRKLDSAPAQSQPPELAGASDGVACYEAFRRHGFEYGQRMRPVRRFVRAGAEVHAELAIPDGVAATGRALLHPVLLDGALQVASLPWMQDGVAGSMLLRPLSVRYLRLHRPAEGTVFVRARLTGDSSGTSRTADITVLDEHGRLVAELDTFLAIAHGRGAGPPPTVVELATYRLDWRDAPLPATAGSPTDTRTEPLVVEGPALAGFDAPHGVSDVLVDLTGQDLSLGTRRADADRYRDTLDGVLLPLIRVLRELLRARVSGQVVVLAQEGDEPLLRGLHALLATAASETVKAHFRLLSIPAGMPREVMLTEFSEHCSGWVRRYPDGRRQAAVLVADPGVAAQQAVLRPDGCYLITGGLGGLGRTIAAELVHRCPKATVVLLGRSPADETALAGLPVRYIRCDVADPVAVGRALAGLRPTGVIHAAGVLRDGFLRNKQAEDVDQVLRPKVLGALVLDAALADADLDFVLLVSSLAAVVGNPGQSDYALANGFLDGFACTRRGPGATVALGLPLLDGAGMRPTPEARRQLETGWGLHALPVSSAAALLWDWLACGQPHLAVVRGDQQRWRAATGAVAAPHRPADAEPEVLRWLAERLAEVTGIAPGDIDPDTPFEEYGMESLTVMRLNRLLVDTISGVPPALAFDHGTLSELARALLDSHGDALRTALGASSPQGGPQVGGPLRAPSADPPLGARQAGIWLVDQAAGEQAPYNISLAWRLPPDTDLAALTSAVEELPRRHPVLSARLVNIGGSLRVRPGPESPVQRRDISAAELPAAIRQEADRRFQLDTEPPLRALLWQPHGQRPVLQLVTHHVVVDGRSVEILAADLAGGYHVRRGARPRDPAGPDFLAYLATHADPRSGLPDIRSVWQPRLAGLPVAPRFTDGDPDAPRFAGGHREFRLRGDLPTTASGLFPLLLGAFTLAVARRTGSESMVVAVPTYGRPNLTYDGTVGCFTNSVPVLVTVDLERSVADWLRTVRDEVRAALSLPEYPYPRIAELCRQLGGTQAVPTLSFTLHNWAPAPSTDVTPLGQRVFRRGQQGHYDLSVEVTPTGRELDLLVGHRLGALRTAAVDEVIDDLRWLCWQLGAQPDLPLREVLSGRYDTLHGRFLSRALAQPEQVMVSDGTLRLTSAEVARRSAAIASWLTTNAEPGEPVGVLLGRSAQLPVALLGVLRAGCPYLPLDQAYPPAHHELVLRAAGCRVVLTEQGMADALPDQVTPVLIDDVLAGPSLVLEDTGSGNDLAYLMSTSGSTGTPKCVAVSHRNVLHLLDSVARLVGWRPGQHLLALTTPCFDISALELFLPLVHGGLVHVGDHTTALDARRFARVLEAADIDLVQATPSGWRLLVNGGWTGRAGLTALCGGETLPQTLADELATRVSALWHVYGPTETCIWSTAARLRAGQPVHLGESIGVTDLVTADAGNGADELWIGGLGTTRGYWRQPALTAECFGAHPSAPESGGRFFRTGDLVRRESGGELVFLGRTDTVVKVRGHRVELAEIEQVLGSCPELTGVIVRCFGEGATARLVVAATPAAGCPPPTLDSLRELAARRLPPWMLPDALELHEAFPLTPNGKVDRPALSTPAPVGDAGKTVEDRVLACWRAVLGTEDLTPDRTFFAAGGNSLQLTRLQAALETEFRGQRIDVADLFDHPTAAQQARLLNRVPQQPAAPAAAAPAVLDRRALRAALRNREVGAR